MLLSTTHDRRCGCAGRMRDIDRERRRSALHRQPVAIAPRRSSEWKKPRIIRLQKPIAGVVDGRPIGKRAKPCARWDLVAAAARI
jgi:hypothetical protein